MKKILVALFALVSVFLYGCGGPSAEEEANMLFKKYVSEDNNVAWNAFRSKGGYKDWSKELLNAAVEAKKKVDSKLAEINKEKVSTKVQPFLNVINDAYLSCSRVIGYSIRELEEGQPIDNLRPKVPKLHNRMKFDFTHRAGVEFCKIMGKEIPVLIKHKGEAYQGWSSSNVNIALTKKFVTKNGIGDYYSYTEPEGKFIIVKVVVENLQDDPITVDSTSFHLIENKKREYDVSSAGMMSVMMSDGADAGFLSKLNPGMKREYKFVFDVPENADEKSMELKARGGFTGKEIFIPLLTYNYPLEVCNERLSDIVISGDGILADMERLSGEECKNKYHEKNVYVYGKVLSKVDDKGRMIVGLACTQSEKMVNLVAVIFSEQAEISKAKSLNIGDEIFATGKAWYHVNDGNKPQYIISVPNAKLD